MNHNIFVVPSSQSPAKSYQNMGLGKGVYKKRVNQGKKLCDGLTSASSIPKPFQKNTNFIKGNKTTIESTNSDKTLNKKIVFSGKILLGLIFLERKTARKPVEKAPSQKLVMPKVIHEDKRDDDKSLKGMEINSPKQDSDRGTLHGNSLEISIYRKESRKPHFRRVSSQLWKTIS